MDFTGKSQALTADAIAAASDNLSVAVPEVWTVLAVETKGCGFLADRRPRILFERHVFSRLTNQQFDCCDFSNPDSGGYGADGANQFTRLGCALAKDRAAALQSASWGMAQIMGENYRAAGFDGVESMVSAMSDSEDAHLAAFVAFLKAKRLDKHLQAHEWTLLAKGYNGPNYANNQYDQKLAAEFQKFSAGPLPDLSVRTAQMYLTFAGFNPGPVDGVMGNRTVNALTGFQQKHGISPTGAADDATLASLAAVALA
jgi:hypothetical protein